MSTDLHDPRIAFGPLRLDPRTITYSTILMLTALALIDPRNEQISVADLGTAAWVIFAPLFAISMAHGFSEAIDLQIRYRRRLTWADRRHLFVMNMQYMVIGVVAFAIACIAFALRRSTEETLFALYVFNVGSLAFWGGVAAYKAGLPLPRQITMGISYGFLGFLIVVIEVWIRH